LFEVISKKIEPKDMITVDGKQQQQAGKDIWAAQVVQLAPIYTSWEPAPQPYVWTGTR
jgi:hypothetical protein